MGPDHAHVPAERTSSRHRGRLAAALVVLVGFLVLEVVVALATGSLALLSDAGHMLTDVLGLGMALAAITVADAGHRRSGRTFGLYRLEILAALANSALLLGVGAFVLVEAIGRLGDAPEIPAGPVLAAAVAGLVANLVALWLLRGAGASLTLRAAALEVLADTLGSVAVIAAAVAIALTDAFWVDPVVALALGAFVVARTLRVGAEAVRVLIQAAPRGLDVEALGDELAALPEVEGVHDLHVWTLTSEMDVASAHLVVAPDADVHPVLDAARDLLRERHGVAHATFQVEPSDHRGCDEISW